MKKRSDVLEDVTSEKPQLRRTGAQKPARLPTAKRTKPLVEAGWQAHVEHWEKQQV